jgi:hypothetical protein
VAWVRVTDFNCDRDHAPFRFAQETPRGVHSEFDLILRWRSVRARLNRRLKWKLNVPPGGAFAGGDFLAHDVAV